MQLKVPAAFMVYAGSYLPLSMILLVQDFDAEYLERPVCIAPLRLLRGQCDLPLHNPFLSVTALAFCLVCISLTFLLLTAMHPKQEVNVLAVKYVPADLMNYVLPYVVSFMSLDYADKGKFSGFLIFFIWIFWVTYKSGQVVMNPVLTVFGWRLYEVEYTYRGSSGGDLHSGLALSNTPIFVNHAYRRALIQDVLIFKKPLAEGNRDGA